MILEARENSSSARSGSWLPRGQFWITSPVCPEAMMSRASLFAASHAIICVNLVGFCSVRYCESVT